MPDNGQAVLQEGREQRRRSGSAVIGDRAIVDLAPYFGCDRVGNLGRPCRRVVQAPARPVAVEPGRGRSAYAAAAAAFERAGRLAADSGRRAHLLFEAAEAAWLAGLADHSVALLDEARGVAGDPATLLALDQLAGHIAARRGLVMRGHVILTAAAQQAEPEQAVAMLAEAASACFCAGNPAEMLAVAERARAKLPQQCSARARFLAVSALGMAQIFGGDAAAGAAAVHEAIALAESSAGLGEDLQLIPWLAMGPLFLREAAVGRSLLRQALQTARDRAAVGSLPFVLSLIARHEAATDSWAVAEATYREAINLARESGQRSDLAFGLAGLAWLLARRGRETECRASATDALGLCHELGTRLFEIWATAALGELELGLGHAAQAVAHFEHQQSMLHELAITDVDMSPAPELVDSYLRLGRHHEAEQVAADFLAAASAKGQPWSLSRALRCAGQLTADAGLVSPFEEALSLHEQTPDSFEAARTRLAYGARLRRARSRVLARDQLRSAVDMFEQLGASPWAEQARAELAATGEKHRRTHAHPIDQLTPQELQIAINLAAGKTTKQTAAALFVSPKTVEYHLRHVYQKLGIHSRDGLATTLAAQGTLARQQVSAG